MNIKRRVTIPVVFALLTAVGCTDATASRSDAIERAKSTTPSLTSTAPPAPTEPTEAMKPDPSLPDAVDVPSEEPKPVIEPTPEDMDGLVIRRLVTASEVEHREPVAASSIFERANERVYAFVEASNESDQDKVLLVHFIGPDEQVSGGIELNIPPSVPRWRTWAHTKHAKTPGSWRVEIRSPDGVLLGALPFEVASAD
jgi:hypothetical protein